MEIDPGSQLRTRRPTQWTCKLNREIFGTVLALRRKLLGSRKPNEIFEIMWAIFTDLRNLKTSHRVDRIFRVVSYGTILVLLCFADAVVEAARESAGGYSYLAERIVIKTIFAGVLAFLCLRLLQPRGAFLIQSLSPHSRRSVRALSILSSIYFLLLVGVAYCEDLLVGARPGLVGNIFASLPLWVPLLMIVSRLSGGQLKRGLALAVAMYSTLFLMSIWILSISRDWEDPWWIQLVLSFAVLASLFTTSMAVWSYYTLPRETNDLHKLLGPFFYFVLLFGFVQPFLPRQGDRQTIHAQMAKMKLIEINSATSAYATHFGGLFPESLDALGPPAKNQKADCRSAGLLDKPFTTNSGGYIFEYRIGLPSRTAPGGCEGAMHYNITARPAEYGKTGHINLYTDESGDVRCTHKDRPANAQDPTCRGSFLPTFHGFT